MRHGDYGYDAPYALASFAVLGLLSGIAALVSWWRWDAGVARMLAAYSILLLANAASFLYTTRRGKHVEWARIFDRLHLRGDERVLDMGCGRGAVLTAVARRLPTGRVIGIDIWSIRDQSGNAEAVANGDRNPDRNRASRPPLRDRWGRC